MAYRQRAFTAVRVTGRWAAKRACELARAARAGRPSLGPVELQQRGSSDPAPARLDDGGAIASLVSMGNWMPIVHFARRQPTRRGGPGNWTTRSATASRRLKIKHHAQLGYVIEVPGRRSRRAPHLPGSPDAPGVWRMERASRHLRPRRTLTSRIRRSEQSGLPRGKNSSSRHLVGDSCCNSRRCALCVRPRRLPSSTSCRQCARLKLAEGGTMGAATRVTAGRGIPASPAIAATRSSKRHSRVSPAAAPPASYPINCDLSPDQAVLMYC